TIRILPSRSRMVAFTSPTFSLSKVFTSWSPSRMRLRASRTQVGHRESVWRGQPRVGLVFWWDFSSGLSDHLGVKVPLGLNLLKNWTVFQAAPAATVMLLSRYFVAFAILNQRSSGRALP